MVAILTDSGVAIRGKQRVAVYNALKKPATGRQILEESKQAAPSMTYQDLRHILRAFQCQGIATCLNPENQTGRFYALTGHLEKMPPPSSLINLSAQINRAKTRLAVLTEISNERFFESKPLTATQVKKNLRDSCPLGLNHVLSALKFLEENRLAEIAGLTEKRELKIYRISDLGRDVLNLIHGSNPTR